MSEKTEQLIASHTSWRDHVKESERARLEVLEDRIERKRKSLDETIAERQLIMNRSIRRMRRAAGTDQAKDPASRVKGCFAADDTR